MKTEMTPAERNAIRVAITETLMHIERAQREMNAACVAASSLQGWADHWQNLSNMADQVKAIWHDTDNHPQPVGHDGFATTR